MQSIVLLRIILGPTLSSRRRTQPSPTVAATYSCGTRGVVEHLTNDEDLTFTRAQ